jgi:hypothetical protein
MRTYEKATSAEEKWVTPKQRSKAAPLCKQTYTMVLYEWGLHSNSTVQMNWPQQLGWSRLLGSEQAKASSHFCH